LLRNTLELTCHQNFRIQGAVMSVKKEASGRRSVQVEVEVPGTPEEVWQAIATGPGISSWMVPAEFEVRDGKPVAVKMNFGPGMEIRWPVTAWEPPRKWIAQSDGFQGSPPFANEWSVEARGGGTCIVRIVQSLFASTDDWDNQLEAGQAGWPAFFRALRIYLTHFRGQRSTIMQFVVPVAGTEAEAWESLTGAVGVKGVSVGQRWTAPAGVPAFSGVAEYYTESPYDALLRLDKPGPGIAALGAFNCGGPSMVALNFYLYGDQAAGTVARETPLWEAWFQKHFPMPTEPGKSD
jgi:uncharacterized protein YndB with AHSA1/START domain